MEYEKIKQLIDDMGNSKLTAIDIDFPDGTKISMKKEEVQETVIVEREVSKQSISEQVNKTQIAETNIVEEEKGNIVKSPMVGTFYTKPSPTSNPYVEVGKDVKIGDTLCIIEAMKLMNEIESEFAGKVTEILVKDGQAVEYGTPLFKIR
ncbi:MAG: acetyl-CoA carboxylase biotin carboxyl carrier protein [Treponema sp.]|nr:acetyl-CoA carboxylase biotin carboxyl carrier protein [Treponema sp.]